MGEVTDCRIYVLHCFTIYIYIDIRVCTRASISRYVCILA